MQCVSASLRFRNLNERPDCVEELALWHQQEWLRSSGSALEPSTFGSQLDQRIALLKSHLSNRSIPRTFIVEMTTVKNISEVIATVSLVQYELSEKDESSDWITNLFVLPEYRNQGIGSRLLDFAENYAKEINLSSLRLYTHDQQAFYLERGWESLGEAQLHRSNVTVFIKHIGSS